MQLHYPGRKSGAAITARQNLLGALRAGQIEWRADSWREVITADGGATYDENGGTIFEPPKYGWPADFWRAEMARDEPGWSSGSFLSTDDITILSAPRKVAVWLGGNGDGIASRTRYAEHVTVDWIQVRAVLGGVGWSAWRTEASDIKRPPARSGHYVTALVRLIAKAHRDPQAFDGPIFPLVWEAFDTPPDDSEIKRLAKMIRSELADEEGPPID